MNYHIAKNGAPLGQIHEDEILRRLRLGELTAEDLCWSEGMDGWQPLGATFPQPTTATLPAEVNPYAPPASNIAMDRPVTLGEHPGFWIRVLAHIIDSVVVNVISAGCGLVLGLAMSSIKMTDESMLGIAGMVIGIAAAWLYYALMESSASQGTLGKMALSLVVTDLQGRRISFARATGRYFGQIVSALIFCIGFLMCAWTERKQCLHDQMAGCLLYRKR